MAEYYIGLLSGTSMDAIDAAIIDFSTHPPRIIETLATPIPELLRNELHCLCKPGEDEINRLGQADRQLGELFADAVLALLNKTNLAPEDIIAIGSHGQTIRHRPDLATPFTLQIGDPNTIATRTGITTVADFRRKDMALGGQGAPLAPIFHEDLFRNQKSDCFVVNIGGIANLSYLPKNPKESIIGFDTGPGNTLMDCWIKKHLNKGYDENGSWATSGNIDQSLLNQLLSDDFFNTAPPKSTGPEYFNLDWLYTFKLECSPEDIQRTLLELTAKSICNSIKALAKEGEVYLCGGGINNALLCDAIVENLPAFSVQTTDQRNLPGDWLEAMLFAWLAKLRMENKAVNLTSVTGTQKKVCLGGIF